MFFSQSIFTELELGVFLSHFTRKCLSPYWQALSKIPNSCLFHCNKDISYDLETVASYHFAAHVETKSGKQNASQPTHWPCTTWWVSMPTCSFERRPHAANICCRSHRTCGLFTANLHFWKCLSLVSHMSLKDNESFVLEKHKSEIHIFSMHKTFLTRPRIHPEDVRYIHRLRNRCSHSSWQYNVINYA